MAMSAGIRKLQISTGNIPLSAHLTHKMKVNVQSTPLTEGPEAQRDRVF